MSAICCDRSTSRVSFYHRVMLTGIISIGLPVLLLRDPHVEMLLVSLEADDAPLLHQLLVEVVDGLED